MNVLKTYCHTLLLEIQTPYYLEEFDISKLLISKIKHAFALWPRNFSSRNLSLRYTHRNMKWLTHKAIYFPSICKSKTVVKKKNNERKRLYHFRYLLGNKGIRIHRYTHIHIHPYSLMFSERNSKGISQILIRRNSKL